MFVRCIIVTVLSETPSPFAITLFEWQAATIRKISLLRTSGPRFGLVGNPESESPTA